jgi:hypothetical protein
MGEHAFYVKHALGNNNILVSGGHGAGVRTRAFVRMCRCWTLPSANRIVIKVVRIINIGTKIIELKPLAKVIEAL